MIIKITGLANPTDPKDGANKKYVNGGISKIPKAGTDVLKLDGSRAMTGNLDMDDNAINNLFTEPDLAQSQPDYGKYIKSAVNKL